MRCHARTFTWLCLSVSVVILLNVVALINFFPGRAVPKDETERHLSIIYENERNRLGQNANQVLFNEKYEAKKSIKPMCSGQLPGVGRIHIDYGDLTSDSLDQLALKYPDLWLGGKWSPRDCSASQSVVIVVPYRNRERHLAIFLRHMHKLLQLQNLNYSILILEQRRPVAFNRGALLNIGYLEATRLWPHTDCVIFHDVDLLPEDARNMYKCLETPLHLGAYVDTANYSAYITLVGGALAIRPRQFISTNGFSNSFWGWGGEDDDMYNRLTHYRKLRIRYPDKYTGRYTMIKHGRDQGNPENPQRVRGRKPFGTDYAGDGLNSVKYQVMALTETKLFTKVTVDIHTTANERRALANLLHNAEARTTPIPHIQQAMDKLDLKNYI